MDYKLLLCVVQMGPLCVKTLDRLMQGGLEICCHGN